MTELLSADFSHDDADSDLKQAVADLKRLAAAGKSTRMKPSGRTPLQEEAEAQLTSLVPGELDSSNLVVEHWSEKTLRDLLETLPDAVVVIDQHGRILLINEQTERFFGYKRAEMLGLAD